MHGCYTQAMTTTALVSGDVVQPSAMASRLQAATVALGEVLKEVVNRSGSYLTEEGLRLAEQAISDWVGASVPLRAMDALDTEANRAAREDVSQRIPPGGAPAVVMQAAPSIDYDRLAQAILAAQAARMAQAVG